MEAVKTIFKKDEDGNILYVVGSVIYLQMNNTDSQIRVGEFDLANKFIVVNLEHYDYCERFECYPLNEAVIRASQKCDTVRIISSEGKFNVPISVVLQYGSALWHDIKDLSRKIYIRLDLIQNYPA